MGPSNRLFITAGSVVTSLGHSTAPVRGEAMNVVEVFENTAVLVEGGRILEVGPEQDLRQKLDTRDMTVIEAPDKVLLPGFVDPHTHAVFGGSREDEFFLRVSGVPYMDILKGGGGILDTVRSTRETSFEALLERTRCHLDRMLLGGTTTVEVKSGYGLDRDTEIKMLEVLAALQEEHPIDIIPTFLGAHALPPEYAGRSWDFIQFIAEEVLPEVVDRDLARFCDIFCEEGIFSIDQSRYLLKKAQELGLGIRFHADEMVSLGGAELACELKAHSADHLLEISKGGMEAMAQSGVMATLLPATPFTLMKDRYAPAREMLDRGVAVALASDFNPGSCPTHSIPLIWTLASLQMKLTAEEALNGITINGAHSLGLGAEKGSIEQGKQADLVLFDAPSYRYIPYHYGSNLVHTVIKGGKVVVEDGIRKEEHYGEHASG